MSLPFRRFLYITFILAFVIITPLLILYANGYTLSLGKKRFVKTGMFALDSSPQGATIYLNDEPQASLWESLLPVKKNYLTTPAKLKNLLPGEYEVTMELPGYWPWRKKLTIYPGTSTYAEDVILFKQELPLLIDKGDLKPISYSPASRLAIGLNAGTYDLIDLANGSISPLDLTASGTIPTVVWSPNEKRALIGKTLVDLVNGNKTIDLFTLIDKNASNLKFGPDADNLIYYQNASSIHLFDTLSNSAKTVLANVHSGTNVIDFLIKDSNYLVVSRTGKTTALDIFTLSGERLGRFNLPESKSYQFINTNHRLINLFDEAHRRLYLIDPLSPIQPLYDTIENIKLAYWPKGNELLYASDFEMWLYDLPTRQQRLLTRLSEPITFIAWHPSDNYVFYATAHTLNIFELDERVKHNITELLNLDELRDIRLSAKGDIVYFQSKIGQSQGLFQINVQ